MLKLEQLKLRLGKEKINVKLKKRDVLKKNKNNKREMLKRLCDENYGMLFLKQMQQLTDVKKQVFLKQKLVS
jgi:hypothetical protein